MTAQLNNVYVSRNFNCSVEQLFKWMVEPSLICQWFGPKNFQVINTISELSIGGKISIELAKPDGEHFFIEGEYMEIAPPNKLLFSFAYRGLKNTPPSSIVQITLKSVDSNIAQLSLVQKFTSTPTDIKSRTNAWENMFSKLNDKLEIIGQSKAN